MKKQSLIFALAAALAATSCSNEKTSENSAIERQEQQNENQIRVEAAVGLPDEVQNNLQEMLQQYLKLKDAFVVSNAGEAKTSAKALADAANRLNPELMEKGQQEFMKKNVATVSEQAEKIAGMPNLDEQRTHLQPLSEAVFALAKRYRISGQPLYFQHCPMANNNKGGDWLSATKEIRNPYFGEKMMNCGSIKETVGR